MKPTLVFDYDGTIHDTMKIYEPAFRKCYEGLVRGGYLQNEQISSGRIAGWLGMNAREMWQDLAPQLPEEIQSGGAREIGDEMQRLVENHQARWYAGASETLSLLKEQGFSMVVLSNCQTAYGKAHWTEFHMEQWFLHWYDCENFDYAPKSEIMKVVKKEHPGDLVMIGDRDSDLAAARAVGCPFVGCSYGYGRPEEIEGADRVIGNIRELQFVLDGGELLSPRLQ
ncbi:MAG: HAD family hydrolase [Roseburia sp.]